MRSKNGLKKNLRLWYMATADEKYRRWKIVIHNVAEDSQDKVNQHFTDKKYTKMISSVEPYPEQPGFHLHIYIQYKNRRYFSPLLKELKGLSSRIRCGTHIPSGGDVGRVELDRWRAGETWAQKVKYLTNPIKDKKVGVVCLNICKCVCSLSPGRPHARQAGCLSPDDDRLKNKISRPAGLPPDLQI